MRHMYCLREFHAALRISNIPLFLHHQYFFSDLKKKIFLGIIAIVNKIYENFNIRLVYIFSSATEKQLGKGNKSFFLQNKNIITDPHKINRKKNMKQVWLYVGPSAAPLAFLVQDDWFMPNKKFTHSVTCIGSREWKPDIKQKLIKIANRLFFASKTYTLYLVRGIAKEL